MFEVYSPKKTEISDINTLTFKELSKLADNEEIEKIGEGSSREVFSLNNIGFPELVFKRPYKEGMYKAGIAQSKVEIKLYKRIEIEDRSYFATIVRPFLRNGAYIAELVITEGISLKDSISKTKCKNIKHYRDLCYKYNLCWGDIINNPYNYGIKNNIVKIIDFGLNKQVYDKYY